MKENSKNSFTVISFPWTLCATSQNSKKLNWFRLQRRLISRCSTSWPEQRRIAIRKQGICIILQRVCETMYSTVAISTPRRSLSVVRWKGTTAEIWNLWGRALAGCCAHRSPLSFGRIKYLYRRSYCGVTKFEILPTSLPLSLSLSLLLCSFRSVGLAVFASRPDAADCARRSKTTKPPLLLPRNAEISRLSTSTSISTLFWVCWHLRRSTNTLIDQLYRDVSIVLTWNVRNQAV